jgi:signal peptidase I
MGVTVEYVTAGARVAPRPLARRLPSALSWVGTGALFAVLLALLGVRALGLSPLVEQTGSMEPVLHPGDVLLARSVPAAEIVRGEVVTFAHPTVPGRTLTHRVVRIERLGGQLAFTTRGDANRAPEHWTIGPQGHVGRLAARVPAVGRLARPVQDPRLRAPLIAVSALLTSLGVLRRIWGRRA